MKKLVALALVATMAVGSLVGCKKEEKKEDPVVDITPDEDKKDSGDEKEETPVEEGKKLSGTVKVAALEGGYGSDLWDEIAKAFEAEYPDVKVELTVDKNIEDVINPQMKAGDYPDVVHLATGRPLALTDTMIKENQLEDISDVLTMTVPGEDVTVGSKIVPGFTDTSATNPYGDGKTYLMPMFYSPCGLFYNANLFETKGWEVPQTWDDMWALAEKAKADNIALFSYPTAGYFDAFGFGLMNAVGGPEFFGKVTNYEEGAWSGEEGKTYFDIMGKLTENVESTVVANANGEGYLNNQQLICDNKALFMPNGTWVTGEMADVPKADGDDFKWGLAILPAVKEGDTRYGYTFMEQIWVPSKAENKELAKEFVAFMYSDKAATIFGKSGAAQPIQGVSEFIADEEVKAFYTAMDENGATAVLGDFAATESIEGVNMKKSLFETIDGVVAGDKTVEDWKEEVISVSDQFREVIIK